MASGDIPWIVRKTFVEIDIEETQVLSPIYQSSPELGLDDPIYESGDGVGLEANSDVAHQDSASQEGPVPEESSVVSDLERLPSVAAASCPVAATSTALDEKQYPEELDGSADTSGGDAKDSVLKRVVVKCDKRLLRKMNGSEKLQAIFATWLPPHWFRVHEGKHEYECNIEQTATPSYTKSSWEHLLHKALANAFPSIYRPLGHLKVKAYREDEASGSMRPAETMPVPVRQAVSTEVMDLLQTTGLLAFSEVFANHGYDELWTVQEMGEVGMEEVGLKGGHKLKLRQALRQLEESAPAKALAAASV